MNRRTFLTSTASAAGAIALGCRHAGPDSPSITSSLAALPAPASSGIEHVVVFMMENRSFDHLLGWLPSADGRQAGLTYLDTAGVPHPTFPLAPDFQGCAYKDPDHSYAGGRVEYDGGACDGWLRVNDVFSIGYYRQEDPSFLGRPGAPWSTFDSYFFAILRRTFPNRDHQHAAQTARLSNKPAL